MDDRIRAAVRGGFFTPILGRPLWACPILVPKVLNERTMQVLLGCLTALDELYLREHPETPWLYSSGVRYIAEPPGQEKWLTVPFVLMQLRQPGQPVDCLPASTLVLRDDYTFAPLIELCPGDEIMGDGGWTTVRGAVVTGDKPILALELANGCALRASPDHRVFLADGREVRAEAVRVGDLLRTPSAPFPTSERPWLPDDRLDPADLAWLVGVYVADGWVQYSQQEDRSARSPRSFCISGHDERPKRGKLEQKDRTQAICAAVGIATQRHVKHVAVSDAPLARLMAACGGHAPEKRVPSLRVTRAQAEALVLGLQADCSTATSGTLTHGTTSDELALQLRVLYRMLDQSVHMRLWSAEETRGLGKNPIWRVGVRRHAGEDSSALWKTRAEGLRTSVRVRAVREEEPELCVDVETSTGRFYLPESDTIVHNCEDLACWRAAELRVRRHEDARAVFTHRKSRRTGRRMYHIRTQRGDRSVEDPSLALGMSSEWVAQHGPGRIDLGDKSEGDPFVPEGFVVT